MNARYTNIPCENCEERYAIRICPDCWREVCPKCWAYPVGCCQWCAFGVDLPTPWGFWKWVVFSLAMAAIIAFTGFIILGL